MEEYQSYHAQSWLKRKIATLPYAQRLILHGINNCSHNVIRQDGAIPAVYLLSNGSDSKFFGHITCKNTWCCPVCTARVMEKRRMRIAAALDALADKLFAFSMTFTIPHLKFQSCHEVTDILYETWKRFNNCKSASKRQEDANVKPVKDFFKQNKIVHFVKVAEYTYGQNGWHPHLHCIFWTEYKNRDNLIKFQSQLQNSWNNFFRSVAQNYWKKHNLDRDISKFMNIIDRAECLQTSQSVNFSVNSDGSIMQTKSSAYVSGWAGDNETTGNYLKKASHNGHYTPFQILELAENGNEAMGDLYIEFCLEVCAHVHQRTAFSKGLKHIIDLHLQTVGAKKYIKKKATQKENWRVLCWFTSEQWRNLCFKNLHAPVLSNILFLASKKEWLPILFDYLHAEIGEVYLPTENYLCGLVESMFNDAA